ncbi:MAG: hypothetical protein JEZ07_03470 [Phycisphaerae bacterium]|nr:hypothetical protein [Phycisphaerae bacterium]
MANHTKEFRDKLVESIKKETVGPLCKGERFSWTSPLDFYSAGVLFPQGLSGEDTEATLAESVRSRQEDSGASEIDEPKSTGKITFEDNSFDHSIQLANTILPSSIGLTFAVTNNTKNIQVFPQASIYKKKNEKVINENAGDKSVPVWIHNELKITPVTIKIEKDPDSKYPLCGEKTVFENLGVHYYIRKAKGGTTYVTISLLNKNIGTGGSRRSDAKNCFFQVGFSVSIVEDNSFFQVYSQDSNDYSEDEEKELSMLYRKRKSFAVGHGCAADWILDADGNATEIETSIMPTVKISPVLPREEKGDGYSMYELSLDKNRDIIVDLLKIIPEKYQEWINHRKSELSTEIPEEYIAIAEKNIKKCEKCKKRISDGITFLSKNKEALSAFILMNRAMLMQQVHYNRGANSRRTLSDTWIPFPPDYKPTDINSGRWRCFQLAFILMTIPGMISENENKYSHSREIVDLIWFPTGGGKTEAYLGLSTFTIFVRRILNKHNSGCSVFMRYTLRLLTAQQFQRASSLICACEIIRNQQSEILGNEPFSLGLWVGQSLSPNKINGAKAAFNEWRHGRGGNKLQLLTCPWCGTELDNKNVKSCGYKNRTRGIVFSCPENKCPFSKKNNEIPVHVVDEEIYKSPPTLIIGTVDKFAMLAWNDAAGAIFGLKHNKPGPDLIIQDELHLISGPLGSIAGLYESVIELLCSKKGRKPKIIASTATTCRAAEQCRSLYNRNIAIFPPQGLDISDSFFAKEDLGKQGSGRLYLGVLPTAAPSPLTFLRRIVASILQSSFNIKIDKNADSDAIRNPYWTLVWYFNSIKELGRSMTLIRPEITDHMRDIVERHKNCLDTDEKTRYIFNIKELTSRLDAEKIPEIIKDMSQDYSQINYDKKIDTANIVLSTNMLSVGIDVSRLGLMLVNGQPKTTSEYIQATSRVGRSSKSPGLVVTYYGVSKPRDRSHYEHFKAYHNSFYKYVEPASVTPFSIPVIDRVIHSLIIIAARHLWDMSSPEDIANENNRNKAEKLCEWLLERCDNICPEHKEYFRQTFWDKYNMWCNKANGIEWGRCMVSAESNWLMCTPGYNSEEKVLPWQTLTSMRGVDNEAEIRVLDNMEVEK